MMRGSTRFDTNQARRQLLEKCRHITTLQLTANDHMTFLINAVQLKD